MAKRRKAARRRRKSRTAVRRLDSPRTRTRRTTRKRRQAAPPPKPREPIVHPETAQRVVGIILLLVAAVLALSQLGIAGPLGRALADSTAKLIGWVDILLALAVGWFGYRLASQRELKPHRVVGALLLLVSISAIAHLFAGANPLAAAQAGQSGGLVGYGLTATTNYAIGSVGSFLVFAALGVIGFLVLVNRNPAQSPASGLQTGSPASVVPPRPTASPRPSDKPAEPEFQPRVVDSAWEQPPLSLLSESVSEADAGDTQRSGQIIESTLANFGLNAKIENVNVGPSVTQYELRPDAGVKLNKITALSNDLALALAAHPIRIEAPIPGKSTVGIEVPNRRAATVRLRTLFEDKRWKQSGALPLALGLDVSGRPVITDLASMPHLLIAGQTGSGKSIGINAFLASLLFTHSPKHLRLLLVDPKRVELTNYNDIPHLIAPVVVESAKVVNALKWVVAEMERRYQVFQEAGVKDLIEFNKQAKDETLPYLVVVIDELADIMAVAGKAVEGTIVRIAQLARATGIHLVIATQRPSTNVITGVIKANLPSRVAYAVASATDSRVVLDTSGAEKLLGKGDLLFKSVDAANPVRIQGTFVDGSEVKKLTDFLKGKGEPVYEEAVTERPGSAEGGPVSNDGADDPLYEEVKAEVIRSKKASASFIQRRFKVGYARAARLLDMLEENGVIGPGEGAKPRDILVESDE